MLSDLKRETFCNEYIVDFNGTQAALRSGYAKSSAKVTAHNLLQREEIQARIKQLIQKTLNNVGITAERVLKEYEAIAFSDIRDYLNDDFTFKNLNEVKQTNIIASIEVNHVTFGENGVKKQIKFRLYDKMKALDSLANYLGILKEGTQKDEDAINSKLKELGEKIKLLDNAAIS